MIARKVNLGRAVIVTGGLLALAALASVFAAGDARRWALVFVALALGFPALVLLGRRAGGWAAMRLGQDRADGERSGIGVAVGLPLLAITLSRWFGLG